MELDGRRTTFEQWQGRVSRILGDLYHKLDTACLTYMHYKSKQWEDYILKKYPLANVEGLRSDALEKTRQEIDTLLQEYNMAAMDVRLLDFDFKALEITERRKG